MALVVQEGLLAKQLSDYHHSGRLILYHALKCWTESISAPRDVHAWLTALRSLTAAGRDTEVPPDNTGGVYTTPGAV